MVSKSSWIFGYGSLIWRPDFPFVQSRIGYIKGWRRVFWQGSADHRGTPDAPGRVATIVADERETCIGMAYNIAQERYGETIKYSITEKGWVPAQIPSCFFENNEKVLLRFTSQHQITLNSWARHRLKKLRDKYRPLADRVGPTMSM